ncbi:MAG: amidohydrolase family protein [Anaerovoracaceae bacterium]
MNRNRTIIDAHAHMEVYDVLGFDDNPEKVLKYMDLAGISKACISTYTNIPAVDNGSMEHYKECMTKYKGKFIPFLRVDPCFGDKTLDALKLAVEKYDYKGVKLHPIDYSMAPFEETTIKILEMAAYYGIPTLYHCSDEIMCLPLQIEWAAEAVPKANIILGHMGGFYHQKDAIRIAERRENVFLETCEQPYTWGIKETVQKIGSQRLLFGTDMPTDNSKLEVEKIYHANLKDEDLDNIFYNNIAKLVGIKEGAL